MLVGNKIDLCEHNPASKKVSPEQAKKFAQEHGMLFEETSAVTTTRVREAFENLLQEIYSVKSRSHKHTKNNESVGNVLIPRLTQTRRVGCCN